jgi:hypothetical protein
MVDLRALTLLPCLLASPALAEGAVQTWSCQSTLSCSANGTCVPDAQKLQFQLSPVNVQSDATGTYRIAYDAVETELTWLTYNGPLIWYPAQDEQDMLLFSGPENLIWQRLMLGPDGELSGSTTVFLTCDPPS